jgi:O-antigen ligase
LEVVFEISCTCLFFGLSAFLDTISLQYLFNTKPQIHENNSFAARIKVWVSLIHLWMENPIFGYGPNKAYMYREKLYPENEYIFYLWRYGIQGVLVYQSLLLTPIFSFYKRISHFRFLSMIIIIIASVAFMNNPMSNAKISMMVAFIFGLSLVILENIDTQKNRT